MRITNTLLSLFVASLIPVSVPAQPQEQTKTERSGPAHAGRLKFEDWAVRCNQRDGVRQKPCILFQRIALESGKTMLSVTVAFLDHSDDAAAVFRLPLGIFLPAGARVDVDKTEQIKLVVERCDQRGCWAPLELDHKTVELFKDGREARVEFKDNKRESIIVPLSLKGFTAGFNEISKYQRNQRP